MEGFAVIICGKKKYAKSFAVNVEAKSKEEYSIDEKHKLIVAASNAITEVLEDNVYCGPYWAKINFEDSDFWLEMESEGTKKIGTGRS